MRFRRRRVLSVLVLLLAALVVVGVGGAVPALAASSWWNLNISSRPAVIPTGGEGIVLFRASNVGDATTSGPATVSANLPAGVSVRGVSFFSRSSQVETDLNQTLGTCQTVGASVSCSTAKAEEKGILPHGLQPYEYVELRVTIKDESAEGDAQFEAVVNGGGATTLSRRRSVPIGENAPTFGAEDYALVPEAEGGAVEHSAGTHPYQLTATFNLNEDAEVTVKGAPHVPSPALARNLDFDLPPGQVGNAAAIPRCNTAEFTTVLVGFANRCPVSSVIGVAQITLEEPNHIPPATFPVPLFNLEPAYGEPARFGFEILGSIVTLDTSIRSGPGGDYGVTVSTSNISQLVNFISSTVTFWGAPGDPSHDSARGWSCLAGGKPGIDGGLGPCQPEKQEKPPAFLTLPTDCNAPFLTSVHGESWTDPTKPVATVFAPLSYSLEDGVGDPVALTGCNQLPFDPHVHSEPSSNAASSPSGLSFELDFANEGLFNTNPEAGAESNLKKAVVALPEGLTANPSVAAGLSACGISEYEATTLRTGSGCTEESKIGEVEVTSPLLIPDANGNIPKLLGGVYLAKQGENPNHNLLTLYFVARNAERGILVKQAMKVEPDLNTGRLTTIVDNIPQLPFAHFRLSFRQGQRAPLVTPPTCGTYTVNAELTPYSNPEHAIQRSSSFQISQGSEGQACPAGGLPPFSPGLVAGTMNPSAGAYAPFYADITRKDAESEITHFAIKMPPGLTGNLSGIPFCSQTAIDQAKSREHEDGGKEEQASPSCPAASLIGHSLVGTGVGTVLAYNPGDIYLAGPYNGDPFSVLSVTSAVVGPFDLGTVVIRFGLQIDPLTGQVGVDPASEAIPHILHGIVTHVRDIRVYIDRPNFILNPTSCEPQTLQSTLTSSFEQTSTVTSRFQGANCANLAFKPTFKVSTSGKTSRTKGASLHVKLTYPTGALGKDANIKRVKVDLPKRLPSRLTTLQKACLDSVFNKNPALCPAASRVGTAKAVTPILPVPIEGPAYFVSHGGAKFPELIIVLQGYGVTIDLHGETFISKTGITSSTFNTVPDEPVTSFELTLPQGPNSALAANGNLCTTKGGLKMPTLFTAQNGVTIKQTTPINITGCPKKARNAHKANKHRKGGKKK